MSCCTLPAAPSTSTSHTLLFTTTLSVKLNQNISSIFFPLAHSSSSKFASAKHKSSFFFLLASLLFSETMHEIRLTSPFAFLFRLKKQCSTRVQENNFSTCASCICSTASQAIDVGIKLFYSCLVQAPGCL